MENPQEHQECYRLLLSVLCYLSLPSDRIITEYVYFLSLLFSTCLLTLLPPLELVLLSWPRLERDLMESGQRGLVDSFADCPAFLRLAPLAMLKAGVGDDFFDAFNEQGRCSLM